MSSCICTVIKDEHQYLDEWIKYHLSIGVNHIFIFEDIDSKSHKEICDKYDDVTLSSIVNVLNEAEINEAKITKITKDHNVQHLYFRNIMNYIVKYGLVYGWCFVLDTDEFVTLENKNSNLNDILSLYTDYDAVILKWKCFGANGIIHKPNYNDKGVIDTYTKEIEYDVPDANSSFMKTCYNIKKYKPEFFYNQHHPTYLCNWTNTDFRKNWVFYTFHNIYIRHYITKSFEEYVWKINNRGYIYGKNRSMDFFFNINPDLSDKCNEEILVVLTYEHQFAQGNELYNSLTLWKKFCMFNYHFVVIGTFTGDLTKQFPWVEFIECARVPNVENQYTPHLDVQHKMEIIMKHFANKYKGFIRTMDDVYAIKPFNLEDITTIHYHQMEFSGNKNAPASFWIHDKWKTRQLLDKENLPHINYATHYPCYFEFAKLKEIWDKFDMRHESYAYEDIYFNYFEHDEPVLDSEIRFGIWGCDNLLNDFYNELDNHKIKFICNSNAGWSKELENKLEQIINL